MKRKGNKKSPLINGVVLAAVVAYLCFYLSSNGMWNVATVFVVALLSVMSVMMFLIYFRFFRE